MTVAMRDNPYVRAAYAGIATGMRGALAMTAVAFVTRRGDMSPGGQFGLLLGSRPVLTALCLAAAGELVVDKLPMTPNRLDPGPLAGRLAGGGITGAIVSRGWGGSPVVGALVGLLASLASSWLFGKGRARVGAVTGLPDPVVAIGEDGLAIAFATLAAGPPRVLPQCRARG